MARYHDMALRWTGDAKTIRRIDKLGGVPLHGFPKYLRVPGGKVVVVKPGGDVARVFVANTVQGPTSVVLATGKKKKNGYVVRASRGSLRRPGRNDPTKVHIRWHAVGQFRY